MACTTPLPERKNKVTDQIKVKKAPTARAGLLARPGPKSCRPVRKRSPPRASKSKHVTKTVATPVLFAVVEVRCWSKARPTQYQTTITPSKMKRSSVSKPNIERGTESNVGPQRIGLRNLNIRAGAFSPLNISRPVGTY